MSREISAQILGIVALRDVSTQQALDGGGYFGRDAAITAEARDVLMFSDCAAEAEVIGVDQFVAELDFLSFQADVGDPMLAAGSRAARDVEFELLIESRNANCEFFDQPASEALRFGDRQFAEFRPGVGNGSTPERRGIHDQTRRVQSISQRVGVSLWHVDDNEVLHIGGAEMALCKSIGEICGGPKLLRSYPSAQDRRSHGVQTGLALWLDSGMIAINVGGLGFSRGGFELEPESGIQLGEKRIGGPTVLGEEMLQAGALAALAQAILITKNFSDGLDGAHHLFGPNEGVETNGEMRISGKTAADAQRESDFFFAVGEAFDGSQTDVINFGIRAPHRAAGDGHLKFAWQIVVIGIAGEQMRHFD